LVLLELRSTEDETTAEIITTAAIGKEEAE
jgi:hypothetical protein